MVISRIDPDSANFSTAVYKQNTYQTTSIYHLSLPICVKIDSLSERSGLLSAATKTLVKTTVCSRSNSQRNGPTSFMEVVTCSDTSTEGGDIRGDWGVASS